MAVALCRVVDGCECWGWWTCTCSWNFCTCAAAPRGGAAPAPAPAPAPLRPGASPGRRSIKHTPTRYYAPATDTPVPGLWRDDLQHVATVRARVRAQRRDPCREEDRRADLLRDEPDPSCEHVDVSKTRLPVYIGVAMRSSSRARGVYDGRSLA